MEELARHGLAVLGDEYVSWRCEEDFDEERNLLFVQYKSSFHVMLSVEGHPAHERRQKVWEGKVPPRFAPPPSSTSWRTIVTVDGRELKMDPAVAQEMKNQAPDDIDDDIPF